MRCEFPHVDGVLDPMFRLNSFPFHVKPKKVSRAKQQASDDGNWRVAVSSALIRVEGKCRHFYESRSKRCRLPAARLPLLIRLAQIRRPVFEFGELMQEDRKSTRL